MDARYLFERLSARLSEAGYWADDYTEGRIFYALRDVVDDALKDAGVDSVPCHGKE